MVEFRGQEVESGWIFWKVLSSVAWKHSCKLGCQDKFLVLTHNSWIFSFFCFLKTFLLLWHKGLLLGKYEKLQEQFVTPGDGWSPVSLECCLKLPHIQCTHSLIWILQGLDIDTVVFFDQPPSWCGIWLLKYPELWGSLFWDILQDCCRIRFNQILHQEV